MICRINEAGRVLIICLDIVCLAVCCLCDHRSYLCDLCDHVRRYTAKELENGSKSRLALGLGGLVLQNRLAASRKSFSSLIVAFVFDHFRTCVVGTVEV